MARQNCVLPNLRNLRILGLRSLLTCTDHYRRAFGTDDWHHGPGVSTDAARWLGRQNIAAFGVETMAPGVIDVSNKEVHGICGELGFTHYENMINLYQLTGRGRFRFIGLPLRIRGGLSLIHI